MMTAKQLMRPRYKTVLMDWWEGRKQKDFPAFVKHSLPDFEEESIVYKIGVDCEHLFLGDKYMGVGFYNNGGILPKYLLPATEQEYNEWVKKLPPVKPREL